ncbi:MAG: hypothetical protein HGA65_07905 [Oscillochloris sp.]|nr:hypothetical protein [Oscillochloris sp.]
MHIGDLVVPQQAVERPEGRVGPKRRLVGGIGAGVADRAHPRLLGVVLDMHLPDVDGRTICLRIREICPDVPILPFTGYAHTAPALHEVGCLPPVFKPTRPENLALALQAALTHPSPARPTTALVSLAQEQSAQIERLVREQRTTLHVAVFADSALKRAGLAKIFGPIAQTFEAAHLPALELLLARMPWTALVADARAHLDVSRIAQANRVPLILIATSASEALAVDTADVACVLLEHDPALAAHLVAALTAAGRNVSSGMAEIELCKATRYDLY